MTRKEYYHFIRRITLGLLRGGALDPRAPTTFSILPVPAP